MFSESRDGAPRVALVGCSARKLDRGARARDFYTSPLFRAALAYAEGTCDAVRIVSAFYGAIKVDAWLEPYDRNLRSFGKSDREDWGARTIAEAMSGFAVPPVFVILAGEVYADALVHGAHWHNLPRPEEPLRGIKGCGARVRWLVERTPANATPINVQQRQTIERLYRAHGASVRAGLQRLGIRGADLEELLHDVFLVAVQRAGENPTNSLAWLLDVVRKLAANHRRRYRHAFEVYDDDATESAPATVDVLELLRHGLEELDDADRDLIVRHDVNGEPVANIARAFGLSPQAVYVRLRAARVRLRGSP